VCIEVFDRDFRGSSTSCVCEIVGKWVCVCEWDRVCVKRCHLNFHCAMGWLRSVGSIKL